MNFRTWCRVKRCDVASDKTLFLLTEKRADRTPLTRHIVKVIRSHYHDLELLARDVERLGHEAASKILRSRIPKRHNSRSGDLGEILGTEFFDGHTKFRIPIRRLRYKDHRETALRGDDIIGVSESGDETIELLKAEAKSRANLCSRDIANARATLMQYDGLPAPHSLVFISDRLLESEGDDKRLGQRLRDRLGSERMDDTILTHGLYLLCGNNPETLLSNDLTKTDRQHDQLVVGMQITDLRDFVTRIYKEVSDLGNN